MNMNHAALWVERQRLAGCNDCESKAAVQRIDDYFHAAFQADPIGRFIMQNETDNERHHGGKGNDKKETTSPKSAKA